MQKKKKKTFPPPIERKNFVSVSKLCSCIASLCVWFLLHQKKSLKQEHQQPHFFSNGENIKALSDALKIIVGRFYKKINKLNHGKYKEKI